MSDERSHDKEPSGTRPEVIGLDPKKINPQFK